MGRDISGTTFFRVEICRGRHFFRADRSLGAKQEGLTIVNFSNKLIVSCTEVVRFPFHFLGLFLNWIVIFYSN